MNNKEETRKRFNADARAYDERIIKHVNGYLDMHLAIINFIPFKPRDKFSVLDLGMGSGKLAKEILDKFPNTTLTGVDFSEQMINMSRARLSGYGDRVKLLNLDFSKKIPEEKYNVIIMVLSLHHLEDSEKASLTEKLYNKISPPGTLLIGDLTKSRHKRITNIYMDLWRENLMVHGYSKEYIENCYHEKYEIEDIPATLEDHLRWLREANFKEIEIFWKRYHFAVFGGFKGA